MLEKLRGYISNGDGMPVLELGAEPQRVSKPVRLAQDDEPIELLLGKRRLRLCPEIGVSSGKRLSSKSWFLIDPERFYTEIAGFERLKPGRQLVVGRENERLNQIFSFSKSVAKRHVTLANDGGRISIKPLDNETGCFVCRVAEEDEAGRLTNLSLDNLRRLREIFGGPIELLPPDEAEATIQQAIESFRDEPFRAKDSHGRPGGLLQLPAKPTPVIVGDIHAEMDNLLKVLSAGQTLDGLASGEAMLLFLGDLVHSQVPGKLEEMTGSLLVLDLICKLKARYPDRVFCLRGNHEVLDDSVGKVGVPQGLVLREKAQKLRGAAYVERLAELFDLLPHVVKTDDFIATHAGPTRGGSKLADLIDIHDHPQLAWQLMWNRLQRPTRPAGYTKKDVKNFKVKLGADKRTPLIVSHTPLSPDGTLWLEAGQIKNHHVVYSANQDRLAVFIRIDHEMVPVEYPVEDLMTVASRPDL